MTRYVTPVLALIIAVALFFTVIQPGFERIRQTDRELHEFRRAIETADLLRARIDELVAERNRILPADLNRLDALLPESVDTVKLALMLDEIAVRNQMFIRDIDIETDAPAAEGEAGLGASGSRGQQFTRTAMSFSLTGTYEQFRGFIADLERNLVLMDIASLKITPPTDTGQTFTTYSVTVHVYEYESTR